eukprot:NODE_495_length_853_cov_92.657960_g437_i0.p1 GENE.NODE_495_length_853_cov_92.657960_g437_i0~~NODE_495_length_853_cov_92.657960_g437_i0.p1  ORF type:complete len:184 (+),score=29.18 NODE_495_length_853_cov_92.657960_g437_i0:33-554(+)
MGKKSFDNFQNLVEMSMVNILSPAVGFVYPAYASFKVVEGRSPENDDTQWLVYWVVFSLFYVVEYFLGWFLSWLPPYFYLKLAFIFWLQSPYTTGARQLYDNFLKPLLMQHEQKIDKNLNEFRAQGVSRVQGLLGTEMMEKLGAAPPTKAEVAAQHKESPVEQCTPARVPPQN